MSLRLEPGLNSRIKPRRLRKNRNERESVSRKRTGIKPKDGQVSEAVRIYSALQETTVRERETEF